jgi:hypothetical protein
MRKNQKFTKEQMSARIESWQQSGISQNRFCKEEKLSSSTFNYWLKKYKQEKDRSTHANNNPEFGLGSALVEFISKGLSLPTPHNYYCSLQINAKHLRCAGLKKRRAERTLRAVASFFLEFWLLCFKTK